MKRLLHYVLSGLMVATPLASAKAENLEDAVRHLLSTDVPVANSQRELDETWFHATHAPFEDIQVYHADTGQRFFEYKEPNSGQFSPSMYTLFHDGIVRGKIRSIQQYVQNANTLQLEDVVGSKQEQLFLQSMEIVEQVSKDLFVQGFQIPSDAEKNQALFEMADKLRGKAGWGEKLKRGFELYEMHYPEIEEAFSHPKINIEVEYALLMILESDFDHRKVSEKDAEGLAQIVKGSAAVTKRWMMKNDFPASIYELDYKTAPGAFWYMAAHLRQDRDAVNTALESYPEMQKYRHNLTATAYYAGRDMITRAIHHFEGDFDLMLMHFGNVNGQWGPRTDRYAMHFSHILRVNYERELLDDVTVDIDPITIYDVHIVSRGERLKDIAKRYGRSTNELLEANLDITNKNSIKVDQAIIIPTDTFDANEFATSHSTSFMSAILDSLQQVRKDAQASMVNAVMSDSTSESADLPAFLSGDASLGIIRVDYKKSHDTDWLDQHMDESDVFQKLRSVRVDTLSTKDGVRYRFKFRVGDHGLNNVYRIAEAHFTHLDSVRRGNKPLNRRYEIAKRESLDIFVPREYVHLARNNLAFQPQTDDHVEYVISMHPKTMEVQTLESVVKRFKGRRAHRGLTESAVVKYNNQVNGGYHGEVGSTVLIPKSHIIKQIAE